MKNTWLYKNLNAYLKEFSIFENKSSSNTFEVLANLLILPVVGCVVIVLYFFGFLLLPLYLIKDFVDLYYRINAEKIEAKRKAKEALEKQQKVEDYINHYQQVLDRYPVYILKQFKIKEVEKKQSPQIEDEYAWSIIGTAPTEHERISYTPGELIDRAKYLTSRDRRFLQNRSNITTHASLQSMNAFHNALEQEYPRMTGISDYNNAKNDRNKEYVELSIEEVHHRHKDYIDFIIEFFNNYNINCDTFNSKTGQRVCSSNRRRSAFDVYLITKYYYNHVTFKDVLFTLIDLIEKYELYTSYCGDVCKYVYYTRNISIHNRLDRNLEFSSELTFIDLMKYKQLKPKNEQ